MSGPSIYTGFASASSALGFLVRPKPRYMQFSTINGVALQKPLFVEADVTIEEIGTDELEVTEHPIEFGTNITDHAFKLPAEIVLHVAWSDSPNKKDLAGIGTSIAANYSKAAADVANVVGLVNEAQALFSPASVSSIEAIYAQLLALQETRSPFDLWTGKRFYQNMLLKSIVVPTDFKMENSLFMTITCKQLIFVNTQTVTLQNAKDPKSTPSSVNNGNLTPKQVSP